MAMSTAEEHADFLHALGDLVVHFSALEDSLRDAMFLATGGSDQIVYVLTAALAFRTLVEKFGAVCVSVTPPLGTNDDIRHLCAHLLSLNDRRNALIHSTWSNPGPAGQPRRHKLSANARHGLRLNPQDVPVSEIRGLVADLANADRKIWELVP